MNFILVGKILSALRARLLIAVDPVAFARRLGVQVGDDASLVGVTGGTFGSEPYLIKLGNHVRVAAGVHFVTHDGGVWVFRREDPDIQVIGGITIGDNVHIGLGATIMPNVLVGNNVVIGAGAVVTRSIPDDTVCAGVPAKVICSVAEYRRKCESKRLPFKYRNPVEKKHLLLGWPHGSMRNPHRAVSSDGC